MPTTKKKTVRKAAKQPVKEPVGKPAKKAVAKKPAKKPAGKPAGKPARKPAGHGATGASVASAGLPAVGRTVPDFRAPDATGKVVTRAGLEGKPFVLYFYPKDDTPGCTVEACDFRDRLPDFKKLGCPVLGVSPDSVKSHKAFDARHRLGLVLLADEPGADGVPPIASAFGVWQEKSMYGKTYMGIVRTTFVVAADGAIAARFDRVKVDGHAEEVLAAVRGLPRRRARS